MLIGPIVVAALLAAVLQGAAAGPPAAEPSPLLASRAYTANEPGNGTEATALLAPGWAVVAPPLGGGPPTLAASGEACSAICRGKAGCSWFMFCSKEGGCSDGEVGTLAYQQCQLLAENCTAPGTAHNNATVTSGEPAPSLAPACRSALRAARAGACRPLLTAAPPPPQSRGTPLQAFRCGATWTLSLPFTQSSSGECGLRCFLGCAGLPCLLSVLQSARPAQAMPPPPLPPAAKASSAGTFRAPARCSPARARSSLSATRFSSAFCRSLLARRWSCTATVRRWGDGRRVAAWAPPRAGWRVRQILSWLAKGAPSPCQLVQARTAAAQRRWPSSKACRPTLKTRLCPRTSPRCSASTSRGRWGAAAPAAGIALLRNSTATATIIQLRASLAPLCTVLTRPCAPASHLPCSFLVSYTTAKCR